MARLLAVGVALALGLGVTVAVGCARARVVEPSPAPALLASAAKPEATAQAAPDAGARPPELLDPLDAPAHETWRVDGVDVVVESPVGIRERRPVVLGMHGAAERAEWACAKWKATLAGYAFVVCPEGAPSIGGPHFAWGPPAFVIARVDVALRALRARYGAWIAAGPVAYAGYSLGATLAGDVVAARPGAFDTILLVELGHTPLDPARAAANLVKGGAARAIVACSTTPCLAFAKRMEAASRKQGLGFEVVDAGVGRGHFFDARTFRALAPAIARGVADDARWSGLAAAIAAPANSE